MSNEKKDEVKRCFSVIKRFSTTKTLFVSVVGCKARTLEKKY